MMSVSKNSFILFNSTFDIRLLSSISWKSWNREKYTISKLSVLCCRLFILLSK